MNQTTPPPAKKTNNNFLIIIIVIVVAILLILIVGGYFGWKYYLAKKLSALATPVPIVTVTLTPTATPTAIPTILVPTPALNNLKAGTMPINDYVIADSNTRLITESELLHLTPWQLKVARNEIYARHGRPFVHKDLQCYFAQQSWYHGDPNYADSMLSAIESKNANTIKLYEQKINSPLQSFDSGC